MFSRGINDHHLILVMWVTHPSSGCRLPAKLCRNTHAFVVAAHRPDVDARRTHCVLLLRLALTMARRRNVTTPAGGSGTARGPASPVTMTNKVSLGHDYKHKLPTQTGVRLLRQFLCVLV